MIGRLVSRGIATQITLLVALSAVIFHLCMSGAFMLNRAGWFSAQHPGTVSRVAHMIEVIDAAAPDDRDAVLRAVARAEPRLDIRRAEAPRAPGREVFRLSDGTLLSATEAAARPGRVNPSILAFGTLVFVALSTTLFVLWAIWSLTAPLGRFAEAVDAYSLDGGTEPLAESGAREIATVARAFNRMRSRIATMMADRTQMLAAVSHDLRTPITRLRLRAEFLEDAALKALMLRDLGQMDALVHSALSFIRDRAAPRAPSRLDLASLLRTVCDEASDLGGRVRYVGPDHCVITGHEDELRRAVGNLVDNAVRVESEAVVELMARPEGGADVVVNDDGPGIPAERIPDMLLPFRRGPDEAARPQASGFGLGLPIVQAIVRAHGGTLSLTNREPHGLSCRIALPASA